MNIPTANPTKVVSHYPTPAPVLCADGSHSCDKQGGLCIKIPAKSNDRFAEADYKCACKPGLTCVSGCTKPHVGHTCLQLNVTQVPTSAPTVLSEWSCPGMCNPGRWGGRGEQTPKCAGEQIKRLTQRFTNQRRSMLGGD